MASLSAATVANSKDRMESFMLLKTGTRMLRMRVEEKASW